MRFVVDAQLPPALARRLETLGHTAEHVVDRDMASASDSAIRDYASEQRKRADTHAVTRAAPITGELSPERSVCDNLHPP